MKTTSIALAIGIIGALAAWWGIATLRYYRSFTETAEGVVVRREGKEVVLRFHQERSSPAPHKTQFSGDAEYAFPRNNRTETLNVGDRVQAYHPPGRLPEARLDRDFSYWVPGGLAVAGVVLVLAAVVLVLTPGSKSLRPLS